jgi:uncharacterized protein (UPF0212 family)
LKVETRVLGRRNRCPKCGAKISLWFEIQCPQGHKLKVRSRDAGRKGRCPACQVEVQVPDIVEMIAAQSLLEDEQPEAPAPATPGSVSPSQPSEPLHRPAAASGGSTAPHAGDEVAAPPPHDVGQTDELPPVHQEIAPRRRAGTDSSLGLQSSDAKAGMRRCPSCRAQISVSYRTCPHCRKYIGDYSVVGETDVRGGVRRCGNCGVLGLPGQSVCGNCGFPLM